MSSSFCLKTNKNKHVHDLLCGHTLEIFLDDRVIGNLICNQDHSEKNQGYSASFIIKTFHNIECLFSAILSPTILFV